MKKFLTIILSAVMTMSCLNSCGGRTSDSQNDESKEDGAIETFTVNGVDFDMVRVNGGTYDMGHEFAEKECTPLHPVEVSTYYIGKTEVTDALWKAVMGTWPIEYYYVNDTSMNPVNYVTWEQCQEFVKKLNQLTGREFRLPTEEEWEFAARGGNKSEGYLFSGSDHPAEVIFNDDNTHTVAQLKPNELGIYDMSGNVGEWTSSLWSDNYSSPRTGEGGWGKPYYVVRGYLLPKARVFDRTARYYTDSENWIGMRLAMSE